MPTTRDTVVAYWAAAAERDWAAFGALLAPGVTYDIPQTRERIHGRDAYLRFNQEYPGDWKVTIERAIGDPAGDHAATWTRFEVDGQTMPGLCFFDFDDDGLIRHITDFWPEHYEPPAGREHLAERY